MGESGADSELVMMAAVHLMGIQAKKNNNIKRKRQDGQGTCETPAASTTPVQIYVEKTTTVTLISFPPQNEMAMHIFLNVIPPRIKPVTII